MIHVDDNNIDEVAQSFVEKLKQGQTIAQIANISEENLETLYALAYQHYNAKNYEDALKVFKALCLYDYLNSKYAMGYAATLQALGRFEDAAECYSICGLLEGFETPKPYYYAAICLLKSGKKDDAKLVLEGLLDLGDKNNEEHDAYKKQAKFLLESL